MPDFQNVRVTTETRDSLMRLKLRVAAEIGHDFSMGDVVSFLVILGTKHLPELIANAKETE